MSLLSDPDVRTAEVVAALQADPSLTVKVLQVARSAAAGLARRPGSVHEAVVHVGLQRLQAWAALMGLAGAGVTGEPLTAVLGRARMCQLLWGSSAYGSWAFLTGLLSGVTDALGVSEQELLTQVPVAAPVSAALLNREGCLGDVLTTALAYESGRTAPATAVGADEVRAAFLSARAWSAAVDRVVTAA